MSYNLLRQPLTIKLLLIHFTYYHLSILWNPKTSHLKNPSIVSKKKKKKKSIDETNKLQKLSAHISRIPKDAARLQNQPVSTLYYNILPSISWWTHNTQISTGKFYKKNKHWSNLLHVIRCMHQISKCDLIRFKHLIIFYFINKGI